MKLSIGVCAVVALLLGGAAILLRNPSTHPGGQHTPAARDVQLQEQDYPQNESRTSPTGKTFPKAPDNRHPVGLQSDSLEGGRPETTNEQDAEKLHIATLISRVQNRELAETSRSEVVDAMLELGKLKAIIAADVLSEKLDFHISATGFVKNSDANTLEDLYPATQALIQMGKPALVSIIKALTEEDRPREFLLNAKLTIIKITGGVIEGRNYVEQELEVVRPYLETTRLEALYREFPQGEWP